jgi:uncharacterized protein (DUF924 family)
MHRFCGLRVARQVNLRTGLRVAKHDKTRSDNYSREAQTVLRFWFGDDGGCISVRSQRVVPKRKEFDRAIRERFAAIHQRGAQGEPGHWRETVPGAAYVVLFHQFSRNIFRGSAEAFASTE